MHLLESREYALLYVLLFVKLVNIMNVVVAVIDEFAKKRLLWYGYTRTQKGGLITTMKKGTWIEESGV